MNLTEVKQSKSNDNIEYIQPIVLENKKTVYSQAHLFRIQKGEDSKELSLKIGRYKKVRLGDTWLNWDEIETPNPKSELTLDNAELEELVKYINQHYYPLKKDENKYISLDDVDMSELVKDKPENISKLIEIAISEELDLSDVNKLIEIANRKKALEEFKQLYKDNATENLWQKWFQKNNWVFGSDFISVSPDRRIDVEHITDFIVKNLDGFVDVIEIKRPQESTSFFDSNKDHGNLVPSQSLTKAITQLVNYLSQLEKRANDIDTTERVGKILKPRGILIYGNSKNWGAEEYSAFRLLNDSLTNVSVLTYNMVLNRAIKMNEYLSAETKEDN